MLAFEHLEGYSPFLVILRWHARHNHGGGNLESKLTDFFCNTKYLVGNFGVEKISIVASCRHPIMHLLLPGITFDVVVVTLKIGLD